jgi:hypothetical protein
MPFIIRINFTNVKFIKRIGHRFTSHFVEKFEIINDQ